MVKNLIFDVGGVLIEYRCLEMLQDYGLSTAEAIRIADAVFENELWPNGMDMGLYSVEEVIEKYRTECPNDIDIIAWFLRNAEQMVVLRPEVWDKVAALKQQGYHIYILSNYSEELFHKHTEGAAFLNVLDGGVVSYQVHQIKPDKQIYQTLMNKYSLKAEECIFFDDRAENVEAATQLGMQGVEVVSREMLNDTLQGILESDF